MTEFKMCVLNQIDYLITYQNISKGGKDPIKLHNFYMIKAQADTKHWGGLRITKFEIFLGWLYQSSL